MEPRIISFKPKMNYTNFGLNYSVDQESTPSMEHNIALISTPILVNDLHISPPTFSRLPPDGHEFPPNFSEPIIITPILKHSGQIINSVKLAKEEKISSKEDAPPLPKTVPPSTNSTRKIYRQDLIITVDDTRTESKENGSKSLENGKSKKTWSPAVLEDKTVRKEIMITAKNGHVNSDGNSTLNLLDNRRRSIESKDAFKKFDIPRKQIGTLPSNWRKDEKSEKSVRDKIAMFSNEESNKEIMNSKKPLNKSTENLLLDSSSRSRRVSDSTPISMTKKAQSVENLDDISRSTNFRPNYFTENNFSKDIIPKPNTDYSPQYKLKNLGKAFSVENLNNSTTTTDAFNGKKASSYTASNVPASYASLPRSKPPSVARTTSFSGISYDDRRRSSINNLLEQRRKSMSKLRGLIIPEKTALGEDVLSPVFDLPEIQNKDAQKVFQSHHKNGVPTYISKREPIVPNPRHYVPAYQSLASPADNNSYKSIFSTPNASLSTSRSSDTKAIKKSSQILPPMKPPRTSLIITGRFSSDCQRSPADDSEDSDSVFSSKISSPPGSPIATTPPEKFALTRTLSSETNTSIASSTASTLTSGSGSQASCSSAGSTPTIDMSRKILKSSSNESYVNRKNILALAKCRSGKDDSGRQQHRYDDEDSTDGCDEEETRRIPKAKQRIGSITAPKSSNDIDNNRPINYRLVTSDDNLVDMVINVASYVEVTSDTDADSKKSDSLDVKINKMFIDEERKASFKAPKEQPRITSKIEETPVKPQEKLCESNELAKWVRNEVARTFKNTESLKPQEKHRTANSKQKTPASVAENIQKFNKNSTTESPKTPLNSAQTPSDPKKPRSGGGSCELRKTFELKITNTTNSSPIKSPKNTSYHERFSSLDSLASSSSGVSSTQTSFGHTNPNESFQNLQSTPTDYGSFSSYGSNHSLITPADIQQIIEEADPPLKTPEAFVVVLQRDTPESSVGVTLAGGADYETKEITIHRILSNSPASKDARLRKGDRLLSINGLSMRGLTHRESVTVLKTPRSEVVMVITRSESLAVDDKIKRSSLGSMTSLNDKNINGLENGARKIYHKASRSLDIDLDRLSNAESMNDECKSVDGAEGSASSSIGDEVFSINNETSRDLKKEGSSKNRVVEILKDSCGLGLAIEGGLDSPLGHKPLTVKKVFMGGAAEKTGKVSVGDIILSINDFNTENMTRVQAWNYMKSLPSGPVKFVFL